MARKEWLLVVSTAVSTLMACAHAPEGYRPPGSKAGGLQVIAPEAAVETGLPEWSLAMPLGEKQDASVLEFLARAEAAGARYVSDVEVVFAAEEGGQLLECRTHITPVATLEQGWTGTPPRHLMRPGGVKETTGGQSECRPDSAGRVRCVQVSSVRESANQYVFRMASDLRVDSRLRYQRQWRLQKSAPECTPREGDARGLAAAAQRVEGRAYGCGDTSSASGCEDRAL